MACLDAPRPCRPQRETHRWHRLRLNPAVELAVSGHCGFAFLLFPAATADHLKHERFRLIDAIHHRSLGTRF